MTRENRGSRVCPASGLKQIGITKKMIGLTLSSTFLLYTQKNILICIGKEVSKRTQSCIHNGVGIGSSEVLFNDIYIPMHGFAKELK